MKARLDSALEWWRAVHEGKRAEHHPTLVIFRRRVLQFSRRLSHPAHIAQYDKQSRQCPAHPPNPRRCRSPRKSPADKRLIVLVLHRSPARTSRPQPDPYDPALSRLPCRCDAALDMADTTTEIDLDSVIDRLLEGELPRLVRPANNAHAMRPNTHRLADRRTWDVLGGAERREIVRIKVVLVHST